MTIQINHREYQKVLKSKSDTSLRYIIKDCNEAIAANPSNPKNGYYADEINYASMELRLRQING